MKLIGTTARVLQKEDVDLYPVLANSVRFGNLYISDFIKRDLNRCGTRKTIFCNYCSFAK